MSNFTVTFNGHDLGEYFRVTYLERGIGNTRNNKLRKNDIQDFAEYDGYTLEEKSIPMGFRVRYDLIAKSRELADILNVSEPAKLVFSDEPNVYYLAVPDGEITTDEFSFRKNCDMFWLIPDGRAHSVDVKEFTNVIDEPVTIQSDFKDKVAGSEVECPHELKYGPTNATSLLTPEDIRWGRGEQVHYDSVMYLDNTLTSANRNADGLVAQWLISYNILETVKRAYPGLFEGLGESERVEKLKKMIITVVVTMFGKGSSPSSKYVTYSNWNVIAKAWFRWGGNNGDAILEKKYTWENVDTLISTEGLVNILAYADPSDGTTPSSVSLDYTDIEITIKLPNGNIVTINNQGSYPTYPVIEATVKGDNGAVSFINNNNGGVMQFGNPDEIDGFDYQTSDQVVWEMMRTQGKWTVGGSKILYPYYQFNPETPNVLEGDYDWTSNYETAIPIFPENIGNVWGGQPISVPVPKNSNGANDVNFQYEARFNFYAETKGLARMHFQLHNADNIPFGVVLRDSTGSKKQLTIEIWIDEKIAYTKPLSMTKFTKGFFEVVLTRFGSKLTVTLNQVGKLTGENVTASETFVESIDQESFRTIPITDITQWIGAFGNRPRPRCDFTDTKFTWINVDKWADIPNLFKDGDELVVNTTAGAFYVNGIERPELAPHYNQYDKFNLDKGKTDITVVPSVWAETPAVKAIVREAHL